MQTKKRPFAMRMDVFNNLDDICLTFNSLRSNFYIAYVRMLSHYYIVEHKVHADVDEHVYDKHNRVAHCHKHEVVGCNIKHCQ